MKGKIKSVPKSRVTEFLTVNIASGFSEKIVAIILCSL